MHELPFVMKLAIMTLAVLCVDGKRFTSISQDWTLDPCVKGFVIQFIRLVKLSL